MNTVVKSSRGREENQRKKKGGGIESKRVEQYTPLGETAPDTSV